MKRELKEPKLLHDALRYRAYVSMKRELKVKFITGLPLSSNWMYQ